MKTSIWTLLVMMACGTGWSQPPAPAASWKLFSVPGFVEFDYPPHYQITPDSGQGESKWSFELVGAEGEPRIVTSGFGWVSPRDKKPGETNKQTLKRMPFLWKPEAKVKTQELMDGTILRATTRDGDRTDVVCWYIQVRPRAASR